MRHKVEKYIKSLDYDESGNAAADISRMAEEIGISYVFAKRLLRESCAQMGYALVANMIETNPRIPIKKRPSRGRLRQMARQSALKAALDANSPTIVEKDS